jgi:CBS domain-containing protein
MAGSLVVGDEAAPGMKSAGPDRVLVRAKSRPVRCSEMAEPFPVVGVDSSALEAATLLARNRLPGLIVTDGKGRPHAVLPASQVVRFLVPTYVQGDPSLARVIDEPDADRIAGKLSG